MATEIRIKEVRTVWKEYSAERWAWLQKEEKHELREKWAAATAAQMNDLNAHLNTGWDILTTQAVDNDHATSIYFVLVRKGE